MTISSSITTGKLQNFSQLGFHIHKQELPHGGAGKWVIYAPLFAKAGISTLVEESEKCYNQVWCDT